MSNAELTSQRRRRAPLLQPLLLIFAFAAILVGLLAFHSTTGSHAFAGVPVVHQLVETIPAADSAIDAGSQPGASCGDDCLLDGLTAVLACLSMLVLALLAAAPKRASFMVNLLKRQTTAINTPLEHRSVPSLPLTGASILRI